MESQSRSDVDRHEALGGEALWALTALAVEGGVVSAKLAADLLGCAVRLYARSADDPYAPELLVSLDGPPTEACIAAAALLEAQSLTAFEFSVWFSGGRVSRNRGNDD